MHKRALNDHFDSDNIELREKTCLDNTVSNNSEFNENNLKGFEEREMDLITLETPNIVGVSSCLSNGSLITMADGSVKSIENIQEDDFVLSFDHELGEIVCAKVHFVYKSDIPKCPTTLIFSNGNKLSFVGEHDLFELESLKYVMITEENAIEFIGKHFYNAIKNCYVKLVDVIKEPKEVNYFEIYTSVNQNCIANGMLNVASDVDYMLNLYEFDENLKANNINLLKDIEIFGLFHYSAVFGHSIEEFYDWNIKYLNIALGKQLITIEEAFSKKNEYFSFKNKLADTITSKRA